MATLQEQLASLRPLGRKTKVRASLLYDGKEASDMSMEHIYNGAITGLQQLYHIQPLFRQFESTLFSPHQLDHSNDRELLTAERNKEIDVQIGLYLRLITPYMLLVSSAATLEYLVRRYEIHQRNVTELMDALLPYHETAFFGRFASIIRVSENPLWKWLLPTCKAAAPLSRKTLVDAMTKDPAVFQFILDMSVRASETKSECRTAMTFYGVTVTSMLASLPSVSGVIVRTLLPYIFKGLKSSIVDYRNATFLILMELVVRVKFEHDVLDVLITAIAKNATDASSEHSTLVLINLFQHQTPSSIPVGAFKFMVKIPMLLQSLKYHSVKCDILPLLKPFLSSLGSQIGVHDNYSRLLKGFLSELSELCGPFVSSLVTKILLLVKEHANDDTRCAKCGDILIFISGRFPDELDDGLCQVLKEKKRKRKDEVVTSELKAEEDKTIVNYLSSLFANSRHATTSCDNPLSVSLIHPEVSVRLAAVKELEGLVLKVASDMADDEIDFVEESIVACLNDPEISVVYAVLSFETKALKTVLIDFTKVEPALLIAVERLLSLPANKAANDAISKIVDLVLCRVCDLSDSQQLLLLLNIYAVTDKSVQKYCLNGLSTIDHLLTEGITEDCDLVATVGKALMNSKDSTLSSVSSWLASTSPCRTQIQVTLHMLLTRIVFAARTQDKSTNTGSLSTVLLQAWVPLWQATRSSRLKLSCRPKVSSGSTLSTLDNIEHVTAFLLDVLLSIVDTPTLPESVAQQLLYVLLSEPSPTYTWLDKQMQVLFTQHLKEHLTASLIKIYLKKTATVTAAVHAIDLIDSFLSSLEGEATSSNLDIVLSLLLSLSSEHVAVRSSSLSALIRHGESCATDSVEYLIAQSIKTLGKEIKMSASYLSIWLREILSSDNGEKIIALLLSVISSSSKMQFNCNLFIEVLCGLSEPPSQLSTITLSLLGNYEALSVEESESLHILLKTYLPSITSHVAYKPIVQALGLKDNATFSPKKLALSAITGSLWNSLKPNQKSALYEIILKVAEVKEDDSSVKACELLTSSCSDVNLLISAFNGIISDSVINTMWLSRVSVLVDVATSTASMESKRVLRSLFSVLEMLMSRVTDDIHAGSEIEALTDYMIQSILSASIRFSECLSVKQAGSSNKIDGPPLKKARSDSAGGSPAKEQSKSQADIELFNVDLIVSCVTSQGATFSTHTTALTLLAALANIYPRRVFGTLLPVLNNITREMMEADDDYSFNILSKVVQLVVPPLLEGNVGIDAVLRVFVQAVTVVPPHRRVAFYSSLVSTLGESHLQAVIILLLASLPHSDTEDNEQVTSIIIPFAHALAHTFSPHNQIQALEQMLTVARGLPIELSDDKDISDASIIRVLSVEESSSLSGALLSLRITEFIASHLSTKPFLLSLLSLSGKDEDDLQKSYLHFCKSIFLFIKFVSSMCHDERSKKVDMETDYLWQELLKSGYDILEQTNQLLSVTNFLETFKQLINHDDATVRHRSLEMFNKKVEEDKADISPSDVLLYLNCLPQLVNMAQPTSKETIEVKQVAVLSIHTVGKHFCADNKEVFASLFSSLVDLAGSTVTNSNMALLGSVYICLATLVPHLGVLVIPHIPKVVPALLSALDWSITIEGSGQNKHVLQTSILASLSVVISTLPNFISPYMSTLLKLIHSQSLVETNSVVVLEAVTSLRGLIADHVSPRIILPPIFASYESNLPVQSLLALFNLISESVANWSKEDITTQHPKLFKFFLSAFEYRSEFKGSSSDVLESIDEVEGAIIESFLSLVMKLNEVQLKPLFLKLTEWAKVANDSTNTGSAVASVPRCLTFYAIICALASELRSLFVPYFGYLLRDAASILKAKGSSLLVEGVVNVDMVIRVKSNVASSLLQCFSHDTDGFMDKARFEIVMEPLISQIDDIESVPIWRKNDSYRNYVSEVIVPCIGQLAAAVQKDTMWKPLHHNLLLKTRSESVKVRYLALECVRSCFTRVGDEYLIMLPETISFLAELLEDDDKAVENLAIQLKTEIEEMSGEKLDSYLTN